MKTISLLIITLLSGNVLFAQQSKIVTGGTIEYNETVNMFGVGRINLQVNHNMEKDMQLQAFEKYQQVRPQFVTLKSKLTFNANRSIYNTFMPTEEVVSFQANPLMNKYNTTFNDYAAGMSVTQRNVQGQQFLVADSTRKIKWKIIPGNTREVAGYTCYEAHGLIQDSLYVVAFYTDAIKVSGGPESFHGLPGMILQVVLPHEHVNWTATKVTEATIADADIVPPKKGKPMTNKQLADFLSLNFRNRGTLGMYQLKMFSL
ncbi:MAG TPA: GLPGLI family protein [Mucilaginibacter sp.]|nr:GLPGLI family protein [Mucilaginibacter sp.]